MALSPLPARTVTGVIHGIENFTPSESSVILYIVAIGIDGEESGDHMTEKEMMQRNVEEFERLQDYMISCDKDSEAYKKMKRRYTALKVILTASGINLTELDIIKE